jgi:hypothetical protein
MLNEDQYVAFRERAKKHLPSTLDSFEFWGRKVGRIRGQVKSKWGEARWYAELSSPKSLHDLIYVGEYDYKYKWDPTKGFNYKLLDILNNMSKFLNFIFYVMIPYKLFFYNVAYLVAIAKNPDCAADIIWSADHASKILMSKKMASIAYEKNEKSRQLPPN